jgi:hypothetical protein
MRRRGGSGQYTRALITILIISIIGVSLVLLVTIIYPLVEDSLEVWEMFLIFYVLIALFWSALFVGLMGWSENALKTTMVFLVFSTIFDIWFTYSIGLDGTVISGEKTGNKGSIDYCIGYYLNAAGITGPIVFVLVYLVIPITILVLMVVILKPRVFMRSVQRAG